MTITKRLLFTLSVALFGMLLVGGYGIWQLDQAQSRFNYVEINTFPSLKDMTDAQHALTTIRVNSLRVLVALNQDQRDESLAAIANADKQFDATLADYLANDISNDADRQLLEADKAAMADYRSVRDKSMDLAKAGSHDQAVALFMPMVSRPQRLSPRHWTTITSSILIWPMISAGRTIVSSPGP